VELIVTEPLNIPTAFPVKLTLTVQLVLGASVMPVHVSPPAGIANCEGVTTTLFIVMPLPDVFCAVMILGGVVVVPVMVSGPTVEGLKIMPNGVT
jgi:hypothetical protein